MSDATSETCDVATIDLLEYMNQDVDLLKIDIEGAEFEVVPHLAPGLDRVRNILVECHLMDRDAYRHLGCVLAVLHDAGFQVAVNSYGPWRDLTRRHVPAAFHAQQYLLVAGWRCDHPSVSREATIAPSAGIVAEVENARLRETIAAFQGKRDRLLVDLATGDRALNTVTIGRPFRRELGHCWVTNCPEAVPHGDSAISQDAPTLLLENDQILGPAHVVHDEIRSHGAGRYSHWGAQLYLSTSDNTDPNTNGRTYRIVSQGSGPSS